MADSDEPKTPSSPGRSNFVLPPHNIISNLDDKDAEARYREEEADIGLGTGQEHGSSSDGEETIVAWEKDDPENPHNWSRIRKAWIVTVAMITVINSTMSSSLPSNAIPFMAKEWSITSEQEKVLPMSVYLIGYVLGPFLWAPLSEQFGRKDITVYTFIGFSLFTMACALAPSWASFLIFRLITGTFGSAPIGIVTGIIADVYGSPQSRGRAMSVFMSTSVFGPLFAPIISGYCSPTIGWRWTFWIGLIYAGLTIVTLATLPETYAPILLLRRAQKIRKEDPKARVLAPHELEKKPLAELMTVVLTRPLRMIVFELLVSTTCAYFALIYAIFYISFQAFPIIFEGVYGLSPGETGLTYLLIGGGSLIGMPVLWWYDAFLQRARDRDAPWTRKEEYIRLPLACFGGPMFALSLFWLGWSARPETSFVAPMMAGIPFGFGFVAIFIALMNYLADAYEIFAASASAAASGARSLIAAVLPLATVPMFARLGISGACSLLGGLSLLMSLVPFLFIWQGQNIRANSPFCIALKARKEELERKVEEQRKKQELRDVRYDSTYSPPVISSCSRNGEGRSMIWQQTQH